MTLDTLALVVAIAFGGIMILASRRISGLMSGKRPSRETLARSRFVVIVGGLSFLFLSVFALITGEDVARRP